MITWSPLSIIFFLIIIIKKEHIFSVDLCCFHNYVKFNFLLKKWILAELTILIILLIN